jgi:hypothetical protein
LESLSAPVNGQDVLEEETGLDDKVMVPWRGEEKGRKRGERDRSN